MKIAKHETDPTTEVAWGRIIGMKNGDFVEFTNCYPFISKNLKVKNQNFFFFGPKKMEKKVDI